MNVATYQNGSISIIDFAQLLQQRRILLCSICRISESLTEKYTQYLLDLRYGYQSQIDAVYLIDACNGKWSLLRLNKLDPDNLVLHDINLEITSWLAQQLNKTETIDYLSKYWSYQALINDGVVEQLYEQPTNNKRKDLIKNFYKDATFMQSIKTILSDPDDSLIFDRSTLYKGKEQTYELGGKLHYYNLWPNDRLSKYLEK